MSYSFGSVSVISNTPTLVIASNTNRKGLLINNNGTETMFIGPDNTIAPSTGMPVAQSQYYNDSGNYDAWRGDVWGVTISNTVDIRYWEWTP